ncbi:MAG: alpha-N-arabinofuranosidase [Candidatus Helarchaeota archaeon]
MVNWQKFWLKFIQIGILIFRLFVEPFGLFKVNDSKFPIAVDSGPPPKHAIIRIDPHQILAEISPYIYGSFIEVLGKCIYGGIWDPTNEHIPLIHGGLRTDVLEEVRRLNISIIRWPGGCFSDVYHWKDGIGPPDQRKPRRNKHWGLYGPKIGPKYDNSFGSDEYMTFLTEVRADPYINVNFGSGTIEEAAQWVEYMNGDINTEYGSLRAKNGHPEPYNIKIWGIANEIFGNWETGSLPAAEYAQRYLEFSKAMRAIDPSIKLVAVGADFDYPNWDQTVLEIAGDTIDYLSLHVYIPAKAILTLPNDVKAYYTIIAGAFEIERRIQWVAKKILEVRGAEKQIPIALDEWGAWWNIRQLYEGYYTLRDGLFAASVFEILHKNADVVKMANYAQLVNVIPLIVTNETDLYHNPIYLAFQLFSTCSEKFSVFSHTDCDSRLIPSYGNIAETELPYLGTSATVNEAKDTLTIIVINRHHAHAITTTISLKDFVPESTAKVFELNGPFHSAYNDFTKKDEVHIQEKTFPLTGSEFKYTFPAHSVTALILHKKK